MSSQSSQGPGNGVPPHDAVNDPVHPDARPALSRFDSNSVRWVFAATVAFWLVVYAAGRSLF